MSDVESSSDYESEVEIVADNEIISLFTSQRFNTVAEHYEHARNELGFDFYRIAESLQLDMYGKIRLINYIRRFPFQSDDPRLRVQEVLIQLSSDEGLMELLQDESLATPVIEGDRLIMALVAEDSDWSDDDDDDENPEQDAKSKNSFGSSMEREEDEGDAFTRLQKQNRTLSLQNRRLQNQLEELGETLARVRENYGNILMAEEKTEGTPETTSSASAVETKEASPAPTMSRDDQNYFGAYSKMLIHDEMLRDRHRTESYRDAMLSNAERLFKDKVVLDVGCGTGILSMFAAKAGARRVVGVDAADIIDTAREIVAVNGFSDVITLVKGKVEEISLPSDVQTVDVIVSEWMGYFLLFESMLPSVLFARDKWLRRAAPANISLYEAQQTGSTISAAEIAALPFADEATLFPDVADMFILPIEMREYYTRKQDFWRSVYGFNMEPVLKQLAGELLPGSQVMVVSEDGSCRMGPNQQLKHIDLLTTQDRDLDFTTTLSLTTSKSGPVEAFCVYFDTIFHRGCTNEVTLTTSPDQKATHWRQTVFQLAHIPIALEGDVIELTLKATRAKINHRFYDVEVSYMLKQREGVTETVEPEGYVYPVGTQRAQRGSKYIQQYKLH